MMGGDGIPQKNVSWILNHISLKRSCLTPLTSGLYAFVYWKENVYKTKIACDLATTGHKTVTHL
jgi:hypothetical protein